ncbi:MAG: DNA polymerase III subunit delta [Pseudobdellovibrionaceae bacterium]
MKIATRDINAFLKKPDSDLRAILVYGPDTGLVKERAQLLGLGVVSDLNDPFNAAHLTGEILESDPSRFRDEVDAQSLMGGVRLVRITEPSAKFAVLLKDWLKAGASTGALVVIEGGDLRPNDAIRKICEEAPNAAALPCYIPDERDMTNFLRELLGAQNLSCDQDALMWLAGALKGDRDRARMEIEKIALYMGVGTHKAVTLADAQACCGDGAQAIDDLIYAVFGKNPLAAQSIFKKLTEEGVELIIVQRSLQNHVRRLHQARIMVDVQGKSPDEAMKALQPKIFFKHENAFRAQMNRFTAPILRKLLARLVALEADSKKTGTPSETLMADAILKLAGL